MKSRGGGAGALAHSFVATWEGGRFTRRCPEAVLKLASAGTNRAWRTKSASRRFVCSCAEPGSLIPCARGVASGASRPSAWIATKQGLEAGLLEVVVVGQRLADPALFHYEKGDTVGERPRLVGTVAMKGNARLQQRIVDKEEFDLRRDQQVFQQRVKIGPILCPRQGIGRFQRDVLGQQQWFGHPVRPRQGAIRQLVSRVGEGNELAGVDQDHGRFGKP